MQLINIWTDGACEPNPGTGSWAYVLEYVDSKGRIVCREGSGAVPNTTNNRMELYAAIMALAQLKKRCKIVLHTDSQYLCKGISSWILRWRQNGWVSKGGTKPILNQDLWQLLWAASQRHEIDWRWVRGHYNDLNNNRADRLCSLALSIYCQQKMP